MRRIPLKIEAPELRVDPEQIVRPFAWSDLFPQAAPVEVEIGIGKGRFINLAAKQRPEINHLGVEWANKYLRVAESRAQSEQLENIRFARVDASKMMLALPTASVQAFYVFYPDPWPKRKHLKNRFLRPEMGEQLARVLIDGGKLHVATDHDGYWAALQPVFDSLDPFDRQERFGGEEFPIPEGEPLTHFEIKYASENRSRHRATWVRASR